VHTHNGNGDLRGAFYLNFSFTIIEIIGGIWTNSIAILSDALHDFGDSLSWACLEVTYRKHGIGASYDRN